MKRKDACKPERGGGGADRCHALQQPSSADKKWGEGGGFSTTSTTENDRFVTMIATSRVSRRPGPETGSAATLIVENSEGVGGWVAAMDRPRHTITGACKAILHLQIHFEAERAAGFWIWSQQQEICKNRGRDQGATSYSSVALRIAVAVINICGYRPGFILGVLLTAAFHGNRFADLAEVLMTVWALQEVAWNDDQHSTAYQAIHHSRTMERGPMHAARTHGWLTEHNQPVSLVGALSQPGNPPLGTFGMCLWLASMASDAYAFDRALQH